jgi:hypothetical protein
VVTENLWPKLFSEAPRCAPLRLFFHSASTMPSVTYSKYKRANVFHLVGIASAEQELRRRSSFRAEAGSVLRLAIHHDSDERARCYDCRNGLLGEQPPSAVRRARLDRFVGRGRFLAGSLLLRLNFADKASPFSGEGFFAIIDKSVFPAKQICALSSVG